MGVGPPEGRALDQMGSKASSVSERTRGLAIGSQKCAMTIKFTLQVYMCRQNVVRVYSRKNTETVVFFIIQASIHLQGKTAYIIMTSRPLVEIECDKGQRPTGKEGIKK